MSAGTPGQECVGLDAKNEKNAECEECERMQGHENTGVIDGGTG